MDPKFAQKLQKSEQKTVNVERQINKKLLESVGLREKISTAEVPEEETELDVTESMQLHKKNVAFANMLTLLTTTAATNLTGEERQEVKELVELVLTKGYRPNDDNNTLEQDSNDEDSSS